MISLIGDAQKIQEKVNSDKVINGLPITREKAIKLLNSYSQEPSDKNHYLMSEAIMRGLAKHFGENEDYWGMLGLLHDVDWSETKSNIETHLTKAPEILREKGFDKDFIDIIVSHGYGFDCAGLKEKKRTKNIEYCLAAAETMTGIIYAYALMRGGNISTMEVKGLKKKFKDKAFAAGCDREIIREIEETGLELVTFFEISIDALKSIKGLIGLN